MKRIIESNVIDKVSPQIIDTFNADGTFKKPAQLVEEILSND